MTDKTKISKYEACARLVNKKIYVGNKYIADNVLKILYRLGYSWTDATPERPIMLFTTSDKSILCFTETDWKSFNRNSFEELSAMEILGWEIFEEPADWDVYKPFDKVLVRNEKEDKWQPRFFSGYHSLCVIGKYKATDGNIWNQCIPYEGNEHAANRTEARGNLRLTKSQAIERLKGTKLYIEDRNILVKFVGMLSKFGFCCDCRISPRKLIDCDLREIYVKDNMTYADKQHTEFPSKFCSLNVLEVVNWEIIES